MWVHVEVAAMHAAQEMSARVRSLCTARHAASGLECPVSVHGSPRTARKRRLWGSLSALRCVRAIVLLFVSFPLTALASTLAGVGSSAACWWGDWDVISKITNAVLASTTTSCDVHA